MMTALGVFSRGGGTSKTGRQVAPPVLTHLLHSQSLAGISAPFTGMVQGSGFLSGTTVPGTALRVQDNHCKTIVGTKTLRGSMGNCRETLKFRSLGMGTAKVPLERGLIPKRTSWATKNRSRELRSGFPQHNTMGIRIVGLFSQGIPEGVAKFGLPAEIDGLRRGLRHRRHRRPTTVVFEYKARSRNRHDRVTKKVIRPLTPIQFRWFTTSLLATANPRGNYIHESRLAINRFQFGKSGRSYGKFLKRVVDTIEFGAGDIGRSLGRKAQQAQTTNSSGSVKVSQLQGKMPTAYPKSIHDQFLAKVCLNCGQRHGKFWTWLRPEGFLLRKPNKAQHAHLLAKPKQRSLNADSFRMAVWDATKGFEGEGPPPTRKSIQTVSGFQFGNLPGHGFDGCDMLGPSPMLTTVKQAVPRHGLLRGASWNAGKKGFRDKERAEWVVEHILRKADLDWFMIQETNVKDRSSELTVADVLRKHGYCVAWNSFFGPGQDTGVATVVRAALDMGRSVRPVHGRIMRTEVGGGGKAEMKLSLVNVHLQPHSTPGDKEATPPVRAQSRADVNAALLEKAKALFTRHVARRQVIVAGDFNLWSGPNLAVPFNVAADKGWVAEKQALDTFAEDHRLTNVWGLGNFLPGGRSGAQNVPTHFGPGLSARTLDYMWCSKGFTGLEAIRRVGVWHGLENMPNGRIASDHAMIMIEFSSEAVLGRTRSFDPARQACQDTPPFVWDRSVENVPSKGVMEVLRTDEHQEYVKNLPFFDTPELQWAQLDAILRPVAEALAPPVKTATQRKPCWAKKHAILARTLNHLRSVRKLLRQTSDTVEMREAAVGGGVDPPPQGASVQAWDSWRIEAAAAEKVLVKALRDKERKAEFEASPASA